MFISILFNDDYFQSPLFSFFGIYFIFHEENIHQIRGRIDITLLR